MTFADELNQLLPADLPHRDVVVLYGDCSFTLTGFDFLTMVHRKLPYVGVIGNNSSWNQIRFGQPFE